MNNDAAKLNGKSLLFDVKQSLRSDSSETAAVSSDKTDTCFCDTPT